MNEDPEVTVFPEMVGIPALIQVPDMALDTMGEFEGLIAGAGNFPGVGAIIFIGIRRADGTSIIGAVPPQHQQRLGEVFYQIGQDIEAGKYDKPVTPQ